MKKNKAKQIAIRLVMTVVGLVIGILVTAQWRSLPLRVTNPIAPYLSLKETRDSLYEEQAQLKNEIKELQESIERSQHDSENVSLTKEELTDLTSKKALAGLTKLNGQGIIITYDDSVGGSVSDESIVHAADLRDTVNELWNSGAEGISINGQRLVVNSAIDCIVNTILVNNTRISNPFRIEVIGDQTVLYNRMTDPVFLPYIHERVKTNGLIFSIEKNRDITLPRYDGSFSYQIGEAL